MKIIVVTDKNWGIGKDNCLLFSLKEDMKHFKEKTSGKTVVMGRKTYESLPAKKPLPNRKNIILGGKNIDGAICVSNLNQLAEILKAENSDHVYIIGGASVYRTMLPYCDEAIITKVNAVAAADTYFENLDNLSNWKIIYESATLLDGEFDIKFTTYKNNNIKEFTGE